MSHESRFSSLGLSLPPAPKPVAVYRPMVVHAGLAYVSGHGPLMTDGSLITGRVGSDLNLEEGKAAARQVGLAILATLREQLGSLDKVRRVIKVLGMVNSAPDFLDHPKVINGCSELFAEVFGAEHGIGARSAVGMGPLPGEYRGGNRSDLRARVSPWPSIANERDIPSPALLIDLERVERNLRRMLEIAGGPERLRPHIKTHKLAELVQRQIGLGISKFKCATIAEAEMLARTGAQDVMLAFPPSGPNIARFITLVREFPHVKFSVIADHAATIRGLDVSARDADLELEVLLDIDCGMHRTGVAPGPDAKTLYRLIAESPGLTPGGLHVYDGHNTESDRVRRCAKCQEEFAPVTALRSELENEGLQVPRLVAGGSPTFPCHAQHRDRELSPGTTVFWDFGYGDKFPDLPFEPAAILLARVVSKPGMNRLCLDLGHKAVAAENPHPRVRFIELPDAEAVMHSEEHLVIETPKASEFAIGQTLHGIPRHVCPTVALHQEAWVIEEGRASQTWPITARNRRISI